MPKRRESFDGIPSLQSQYLSLSISIIIIKVYEDKNQI